MSDSVKKIKISSYDDLFIPSTPESFNEGTPAKITLDKLVPFPHHPFKLYQDERMQEMVSSVKANGILTPILVRPGPQPDQYEIISGHNRAEAARQAGLTEMPAIIRQMDDETAVVAMVDSNLRQREQLLPSERAFAYKMKLEAIKKQGERSDLTCGQVDHKLTSNKSRDIVADQAGESSKQIQRFIRLTQLTPDLLDLVDESKMAFNPAVAISYLNQEQQSWLYDIIKAEDCSPSLSQADRLKQLAQQGKLDQMAMKLIMSEQKPQYQQITIKQDKIAKYFPRDATTRQVEETIIKLLENWYRKRHQDHGSR